MIHLNVYRTNLMMDIIPNPIAELNKDFNYPLSELDSIITLFHDQRNNVNNILQECDKYELSFSKNIDNQINKYISMNKSSIQVITIKLYRKNEELKK